MFHDMFVHESGLRRAQGTQKWTGRTCFSFQLSAHFRHFSLHSNTALETDTLDFTDKQPAQLHSPLNFKLSFPRRAEMRPMRAIPRKSRQRTPTTQRGEQGAEKEGEHRHFDNSPQRRQHHRRVLAFVPTNLPDRDIQGENTTLSLRGSEEGCNKRLPPDREQYIQQPQRAPTSLAITRAQARRSSRRAPRRRVILCSRPSLHKHPSLPLC
jgi:hypothetical protein